MIQQKVDLFIASHQGMFPDAMKMQVYDMLSNSPEEKNISLQCIDFKNPTTALLLSIFLGYLGIDRFYLGDIMQGVGKLITGGGCGVWTVIDWFLIMDAARNKNFQLLSQALSY